MKTLLKKIALTLLVSFLLSPSMAADRPNIVWILSEDNSKHYLKLFNETGAPTPHIEKLAKSGVIFDRAFSNAPVCSVARTTLLTSCYAPRIGTQFHRKSKLVPMPQGLEMFPAYLKKAGYHTTNNSKKDYNAIEGKGVWDQSNRKATWRNRPNKKTPFFHMRTFGQSHESSLHFKNMKKENSPGKNTKLGIADYHPKTDTFRYTYNYYHQRIQTIDQQIGKMIDQLKKDDLLEDTFIFYFGDHGGVLPGSKGYIKDAGIHVPLVVRIPENFKDKVHFKRGERSNAFVSFIDFGPTVLNLAGVNVPDGVDGKPFLGKDVNQKTLSTRNSAFAYADRFDEKYDLCRSIRVGNMKYVRNYQPHFPDGLQNNYRYKMLAYQEWRKLFKEGKLNAEQSQFFLPKEAEALYDLGKDPHEVKNLAKDPQHKKTLMDLRKKLRDKMVSINDLSVFPENYLVDKVFANPTEFGKKNSKQIQKLIYVSELALHPFNTVKMHLELASRDPDPWTRYWAMKVCASFGDEAKSLIPAAKGLLSDSNLLVRLRACEFLTITKNIDPMPIVTEILNSTTSSDEALIILNTIIWLNDHTEHKGKFDISKLNLKVSSGNQVGRRLEYLKS